MQKKWVNALVLLALGFLAFYLYQKYKVAPDLTVQQLPLSDLDGRHFDMASLNGKKTAICFAASWCGPCREELKMIGGVKDQLMKDVTVVVVSDEAPEEIEAMRAEFPYDYIWLRLDRPFSEFGIYSIPTSYLMNRKGSIVKKTVGFVDWEDPSTSNYLNKLME